MDAIRRSRGDLTVVDGADRVTANASESTASVNSVVFGRRTHTCKDGLSFRCATGTTRLRA